MKKKIVSKTEAEVSFFPIGSSGLKTSGAQVIEEFLTQLRGSRAAKLYQEMEYNSAPIAATMTLIRSLVGQVDWSIEEAKKPSDLVQARRAATLVESAMLDMEHTWSDFIGEILTACVYGFSLFEVVYKIRRGDSGNPLTDSSYSDGLIGWRGFYSRAQDTIDGWEWDESGRVCAAVQMDPYSKTRRGRVVIPLSKCFHFRVLKHKDNPEGRSLLRSAVIPYVRLKRIEEFEVIGIERDLTGLPVLEVPLEIMSSSAGSLERVQREQYEKMLAELKRDERDFLLMPTSENAAGKTGYNFRLLQGGGSRQLDTVRVKDSYKTDILQTFLSQFLQLGQQQAGGSYSLASSSTNLFTLALGALVRNIQETLNRNAVKPLCLVNDFAIENIPSIVAGDIETPNLTEIGTFIQTLFTAGLLQQNPELEKRIYSMAGLPYKDETPIGIEIGNKNADQLADEALASVRGEVPANVSGSDGGGI